MSAMTFDPKPLHGVVLVQLIQFYPKVLVLNRPTRGCFLTVRLPTFHPLGDALSHVLRVRRDRHLGRSRKCAQTFNGCPKLHAIVGRSVLCTVYQSLMCSFSEKCGPPAGSGIPTTSTVGKDFNFDGDHWRATGLGKPIEWTFDKRENPALRGGICASFCLTPQMT